MTTTTTTTTLARGSAPTPFGSLTLLASDAGLRAVLWPDDRPGRVRVTAPVEDDPSHPVLTETVAQLDAYAEGRLRTFDLPRDPLGTPFQRRVWEVLAAIPYGTTWSYTELARRAATPSAVRAVAGAVGRNPLSIVVPCHRVVGRDGRLTGFAGGLDVKRRLLDLEAR